MKIGSLFSGIGGLELGLERAGVGHTVWQVERDPFCRQVLARHWPDATRYEDVTTVDWSTVEPVEVMCGGFPCQPFSTAGTMRGVFDERWGWPWFADAIRVLRPRFVVMENVATLVGDQLAFGTILADLHALGFDAEWSVVRADAVGAPHRRPRLFLLAHAHIAEHGGRRRVPDEQTGRRHNDPMAHPHRCRTHVGGTSDAGAWASEPGVGRMADGPAARVDRHRLHALGNAVVPQVAEFVGRRVMELAA